MLASRLARTLFVLWIGVSGMGGCALLQLPVALINAAVNLVGMTLNTAVGVVDSAAKVAPYGMLFVQKAADGQTSLAGLTGTWDQSGTFKPIAHPNGVLAEAADSRDPWDMLVVLCADPAKLDTALANLSRGDHVLAAYRVEQGGLIEQARVAPLDARAVRCFVLSV